MMIALLPQGTAVRSGVRHRVIKTVRAESARFLVAVAIMGVTVTGTVPPGVAETRFASSVVTSVSMSVEALLGDCPKWLPWCVV